MHGESLIFAGEQTECCHSHGPPVAIRVCHAGMRDNGFTGREMPCSVDPWYQTHQAFIKFCVCDFFLTSFLFKNKLI